MTQTCAPADQTVSGWHWVERDSSRFPAEWNAEVGNKNGPGWWLIAGDGYWPELAHERGYRYMCPCPTPEQIAEREAEQWAKYAELHAVLSELCECAELRGDNELPHPSDDPKMWTARMQEAWAAAMDIVDGDEFRASVSGSRKHEP